MLRLVAVVCALLAAVPAVAQVGPGAAGGGAVYRATEPEGAVLRVVGQDAASVTVEVTARWATPLADEVARGGAALAVRASAGTPVLTHAVDLMASVPPPVTVVAFEGEEARVDDATAEALADLARPAAEVIGVGRFRRTLVGTLAVAVLRLEGDRLVRARRVVVRVPRPPVVAALAAARSGAPAVTRSVLDEGRWFKVPVSKAGVYRIDAEYLREGLGVEGADPARVAVYGNGARILPAPNAAPRPVDLLEIPTLVRDGAVLFYAEGPTYADAPSWWDWVPPTRSQPGYWSHDIHPFSRVSHVFVRVDAPAPRRLGAATFPDWPDAERLATIEDRVFWEDDVTNIIRDGAGSGLDWLGPDLARGGAGLTVLDTVTVPGLAGARVSYRTRVAAQASPALTITARVDSRQVMTATPRRVNLSDPNETRLGTDALEDWIVEGPQSLAVEFSSAGGNSGAFAWVDWVEAVVERPAVATGGALAFPTPGGRAGRFEVALQGFASEPEVWDVTAPDAVRRLGVRAEGGTYRVQAEAADTLRARELYAFDAGAVRTPAGVEGGAVAVANQNLRGVTGAPDYVVVTHRDFLDQAQRLAERRRTRDGLEPVVVTTEQVHNEFSGGTPDMRAVRDYMKFLYDRVPASEAPRYLVLFGDGHFDYRDLRGTGATNFVLPYQTENMLNRSRSYTSDDYFGLLDDDEGDWENDTGGSQRVDVGIGRIPARTAADARAAVNKIVRYEDPATFGPWRNRFTFVADDQFPNLWDVDLHVLNADGTAVRTQAADSSITLEKIYAPAYALTRTARGTRRPQVNEAIEESINRGTLVWNYSGHGSPDKLGDENYLTEEMAARLDNPDRLPVFVTVTCSVGHYDIPDEQSLAEQIFLRPDGGGIAMFTTVRLVYTASVPGANNNFGLNIELSRQMVTREPDGRPARLGDVLLRAKQSRAGGSLNTRKFNLLGDPAVRLGLPERRVEVEATPTLTAFERATVSGRVLGPDGAPDPTFSGEVDVTVYDAARVVELDETVCPNARYRCETDEGDPDPFGEYVDRTGRIYSGRASVEGGAFSTEFLVPQDVSYSGLPARVVAYAAGAATDGSGVTEGPRVSAEAGTRPDDGEGPEIRLFVGDSTFVDGGEVGRGGTLVARLSDASGINTVGAGVGHELLLTVDGDAASAVDVGRFYEGDLNTFRSGTVRVPLRDLDLGPGEHTLELTAWDALNNASSAELRVVVVDEGLVVENLFPYPNPTAGPTRFTFDHNQAGRPARLQLRVYTVAGRPVRTIDGDEALPGGLLAGRTVQVPWDGLDDDGDRLATGVYLFRLRLEVDDPSGSARVVERVERLAIIR